MWLAVEAWRGSSKEHRAGVGTCRASGAFAFRPDARHRFVGRISVKIVRRVAMAAALTGAVAGVSTACVATNRPSTGRESGKQPIVFVHGYTMQNIGMWATARLRLQAAGYAP